MYQPLILQRLSKIVLPQITTEDNLIMINCTFHAGYVFFLSTTSLENLPKKMSHNFCFPQGRVLKYPSKGQSPFSRSGEGGRCIFGLFGWTDDASSFWHKRRSRIWALDPMSCCCQEIPYYQVISLGTKKRRAPTFYLLGRVKKSCDARRKVRRCLKALVVGSGPYNSKGPKGTPFPPNFWLPHSCRWYLHSEHLLARSTEPFRLEPRRGSALGGSPRRRRASGPR